MVAPETYINLKYPHPLMREITLLLNNFNAPLSSSEIMKLCKTTHHGKRYGIRRIETCLNKLVKDGDLILERKPTGGAGAPTKLYSLSDGFKRDLNDYMTQRDYDRTFLTVAYVASRKE